MLETNILNKEQRDKELAKIAADTKWITEDLKSRLPETLKYIEPLDLDKVIASCPELAQHCNTLAALDWYQAYLEKAEDFNIEPLTKN
jgi:hypothetical protein